MREIPRRLCFSAQREFQAASRCTTRYTTRNTRSAIKALSMRMYQSCCGGGFFFFFFQSFILSLLLFQSFILSNHYFVLPSILFSFVFFSGCFVCRSLTAGCAFVRREDFSKPSTKRPSFRPVSRLRFVCGVCCVPFDHNVSKTAPEYAIAQSRGQYLRKSEGRKSIAVLGLGAARKPRAGRDRSSRCHSGQAVSFCRPLRFLAMGTLIHTNTRPRTHSHTPKQRQTHTHTQTHSRTLVRYLTARLTV